MTYQGAARDAASVHFRPSITRTDILFTQVAVPADWRLLQAARVGPGRDGDADGVPAVHRADRRAVLGQRGRALAPLEDGASLLAVLLAGVHAVACLHSAGGAFVSCRPHRRQQDDRCTGAGKS